MNAASPYFEVKDEDWDRVLDSNLKAVHWGCQVFGRHMAEHGGGSILNIASVTSALPLSRVFAYSASKAAVVNLTQNVARELAPMGVRVNALCPGFFPAEQNRKILDPARVENIMRNTPMARFGEPDELVGATLLLLSKAAGSFITGRHLLRRWRLHRHAVLSELDSCPCVPCVTISLVPQARGGPFVFWDDLEPAAARRRRLGFDAVEIFPPGPDGFDPQQLRDCSTTTASTSPPSAPAPAGSDTSSR